MDEEMNQKIRGLFKLFAYHNDGYERQWTRMDDPPLEILTSCLTKAFSKGGFVRLDSDQMSNNYIASLEMYGVPGKFRLVALTRDADSKKELWEWWEAGNPPFRGKSRLGDDIWDDRTFCVELSEAIRLFCILWCCENEGRAVLDKMKSIWDPSR